MLSPVGKMPQAKRRRGNSVRNLGRGRTSTQQRPLESELKFAHRAERIGEDHLKVLDCLQQRIGLGTIGCFASSAQPGANPIRAPAQALEQMVNRLQGERQPQGLRCGFDEGVGQQPGQQLRKQRGTEGVTREHLGPENGERAAAAATLAAIGTKDPLSPGCLAVGFGGIVAVEQAVPV